jgi:Arc/MetJ-type ribon-helix-helix transcriptional regulator
MEKRIYIRVPEQLLKDFDRACEANYTTKSEVLRRAMLDYIRQNQKEEEEVTTKMSWTEIMDKARHLALNSGTFTDDPEEKADDVYLVKDIRLVVDAFAKDIEEGKLGSYSEPAEFLDKHGIEWE